MGHDRRVTTPSASATDPALLELAQSYGVATDYHDWRGTHVQVPEESVTAVLQAMGVDVSDPAAALRARHDAPWQRMLPPSVVTVEGRGRDVAVHVDHGEPVELWVDLEDGGRRHDVLQLNRWVDPRTVEGRLIGEATFLTPADLPTGYHVLHARSGDTEAQAPLVVTPAWLGLPAALADTYSWGLATQLYSVRSRASWGVGDLVDLQDLSTWAGDLGAAFVLVNPLHAAEPTPPLEPSPYLPTSRQFFNPLYLRV